MYTYAGEGDAEVAIMFSFQNGDGGTNDASGGNIHLPFKSDNSPSNTTGTSTTEEVEGAYKGSVLGVGQSHIFQTPVIRNILTTGGGNPPVPNGSTLHTDERRNTTTASTNPIVPPEEGRDTFSPTPTNGTTTADLGRPTTTDLSAPNGTTDVTQASGREASFGRASISESRGSTSFFGRKRESTVDSIRNADGTSTRVLSTNSKGQRIKQVYYDEESFAIATMTSSASSHTGNIDYIYMMWLYACINWRFYIFISTMFRLPYVSILPS